jgi:hypothetical protein
VVQKTLCSNAIINPKTNSLCPCPYPCSTCTVCAQVSTIIYTVRGIILWRRVRVSQEYAGKMHTLDKYAYAGKMRMLESISWAYAGKMRALPRWPIIIVWLTAQKCSHFKFKKWYAVCKNVQIVLPFTRSWNPTVGAHQGKILGQRPPSLPAVSQAPYIWPSLLARPGDATKFRPRTKCSKQSRTLLSDT